MLVTETAERVRRGGSPNDAAREAIAFCQQSDEATRVVVGFLSDPAPEVQEFATVVVVGVGAKAVPDIEQALRVAPAVKKEFVAQALLRVGEPGRAATVRALSDPELQTRRAVLVALGKYQPPYSGVEARLHALLNEEKDPASLALAISVLGRYPAELPRCIPVLEAKLGNPDRPVRKAAFLSLCQSIPTPHREPTERVGKAAFFLADYRFDPNAPGGDGPGTTPERLLDGMSDWSELKQRARTKSTESVFGESGANLLTLLYQRCPDRADRKDVVYALAEVAVRESVPIFRSALQDKELDVRVRAAEGLGRLGPVAKEAVADLQKVRDESKDMTERESMSSAIRRIEGGK